MKKKKRDINRKHFLKTLKLKSNEALCEECGTVYNSETEAGLCRYCSEEPEVPELEEMSAKGPPPKEAPSRGP